VRFTEPEHQAALGQHLRVVALRMLEHSQRLLISSAWITYRMREPTHRLDVLREDLETRINNRLDILQHGLEVRRQCLNARLGTTLLDRPNARCVMSGTAVSKVVAVH